MDKSICFTCICYSQQLRKVYNYLPGFIVKTPVNLPIMIHQIPFASGVCPFNFLF